jgi:hypothetical protein
MIGACRHHFRAWSTAVCHWSLPRRFAFNHAAITGACVPELVVPHSTSEALRTRRLRLPRFCERVLQPI